MTVKTAQLSSGHQRLNNALKYRSSTTGFYSGLHIPASISKRGSYASLLDFLNSHHANRSFWRLVQPSTSTELRPSSLRHANRSSASSTAAHSCNRYSGTILQD